MKAMSIIILVVAFILGSLWFVTSQISGSDQDTLKKEFTQNDKSEKPTNKKKKVKEGTDTSENYEVDYVELAKKNNKINAQQELIREKIKNSSSKNSIKNDVPTIDILLDQEDEVIKDNETTDSILDNMEKEIEYDYSKDNRLEVSLDKWTLRGTQKNVLMIDFSVTNKSGIDLNEDLKVSCSVLDKGNELIETKHTRYHMGIEPHSTKKYKRQIIGKVNEMAADIQCYIEEKKEEVKVKKNNDYLTNDKDIVSTLLN